MSDLSAYLPIESLEPDADTRELAVLAHVHNAEQAAAHPSQRSVAAALGMSLGLTNAILKRLTDKGFLMMRRINHNNVHYLVTPDGIDQISRRSYLYIRRTIGHVVRYKERLRAWCHAQKKAGTRRIVLAGQSDLEFLLEWCAHKEGLEFSHAPATTASVVPTLPATPTPPGTVTVLAETYTTAHPPQPAAVLVRDIVFGRTGEERQEG